MPSPLYHRVIVLYRGDGTDVSDRFPYFINLQQMAAQYDLKNPRIGRENLEEYCCYFNSRCKIKLEVE